MTAGSEELSDEAIVNRVIGNALSAGESLAVALYSFDLGIPGRQCRIKQQMLSK